MTSALAIIFEKQFPIQKRSKTDISGSIIIDWQLNNESTLPDLDRIRHQDAITEASAAE